EGIFLNFDVEARTASDRIDSLFERRNAFAGVLLAGGEGIGTIDPRARVEALDLGEREVDRVPAAFGFSTFRGAFTRAGGKALGDVRRTRQIRIVNADQTS